jgi:hypothetical protein
MRVQECPQCRWVPVVDGAGRRRLEMRWGQQGNVAALSSRTGAAVAASAA